MNTYTADQAVAILTGEGFDIADVNAAFDSMVDAGFELAQPDDGYILTAVEVDVLRDQLNSPAAE
jgi:hypothetical protein